MNDRLVPARTPAVVRDRRSGVDRRRADKGPPSGRDRRVGVEPRKPEVSELDVSIEEWDALQSQAEGPRPTS